MIKIFWFFDIKEVELHYPLKFPHPKQKDKWLVNDRIKGDWTLGRVFFFYALFLSNSFYEETFGNLDALQAHIEKGQGQSRHVSDIWALVRRCEVNMAVLHSALYKEICSSSLWILSMLEIGNNQSTWIDGSFHYMRYTLI